MRNTNQLAPRMEKKTSLKKDLFNLKHHATWPKKPESIKLEMVGTQDIKLLMLNPFPYDRTKGPAECMC